MVERTIATTTHGRYLRVPTADGGPAPLLVGFHGYGESADTHLARMQAIAGAARWNIVSVQGLHRFYDRRSQTVIASWMTRQDRELAIADNLAYIAAIVDAEAGATRAAYAGFSQGVAMAFRAAAASVHPVAGVIAVGGDIPPELDAAALARLGRVLLLRGARDDWYTTEKFAADQRRLRDAGVALTAVEFDGGHEWNDPVLAAAADFLQPLT